MNTSWRDTFISLALIGVIVLFLPRAQSLWMTSAFMPSVFFLLALIFVIFGIFVLKERAIDEREEKHRLQASRIAFLVGATLLVAGIVIRTLDHTLDPWLLITLITMIGAKLIARLYYAWRQ